MRSFLKASLLIAGIVGFNIALAATSSKPNLLFVQTAAQAEIQPITMKNKSAYQLTLTDVSPNTVYFSDRPMRIAGNTTTETFVAKWGKGQNNFKQDKPNASIAYTDSGNKLRSLAVVKLTQPNYNLKTNTLTYVIYPEGQSQLTAGTFTKPTIFIDGWNWNV